MVSDTLSPAEQAELDQHGIVRVPSETFVWREYRYSNAKDALAAARRAKSQ